MFMFSLNLVQFSVLTVTCVKWPLLCQIYWSQMAVSGVKFIGTVVIAHYWFQMTVINLRQITVTAVRGTDVKWPLLELNKPTAQHGRDSGEIRTICFKLLIYQFYENAYISYIFLHHFRLLLSCRKQTTISQPLFQSSFYFSWVIKRHL